MSIFPAVCTPRFRQWPRLHVQPVTEENQMKNQDNEIRIYVACLASYNHGILYGAWINACQEKNEIWVEIETMLSASPIINAEEYAVHDYEGFEGVSISEYEGIDSIVNIAEFITEHGALGGKLIEHFGDIDDAKASIEEQYAGEYLTVADFAEEITSQTAEIPNNLRFYIDYEHMARDLEINDIFWIETAFQEVHIFWQC